MKFRFITLLIFASSMLSFNTDSHKGDQLRYSRVRQAYADKEEEVKSLLLNRGLEIKGLQLYLRAFKQEKELELWGRNTSESQYRLIKTYAVCRTSGKPGPKRKQGDLQIPEGFYHINRFNPASNFYLSLGLNYPNKSDRILGVKDNLGGDIFIHGACVTIGCLPITDAEIKELYVFCIEAVDGGQQKMPVTIFRTILDGAEYERLKTKYIGDDDKLNLWADLKKGYDYFNENKQLPTVGFLFNGRHTLN